MTSATGSSPPPLNLSEIPKYINQPCSLDAPLHLGFSDRCPSLSCHPPPFWPPWNLQASTITSCPSPLSPWDDVPSPFSNSYYCISLNFQLKIPFWKRGLFVACSQTDSTWNSRCQKVNSLATPADYIVITTYTILPVTMWPQPSLFTFLLCSFMPQRNETLDFTYFWAFLHHIFTCIISFVELISPLFTLLPIPQASDKIFPSWEPWYTRVEIISHSIITLILHNIY